MQKCWNNLHEENSKKWERRARSDEVNGEAMEKGD